MLTPQHRLAGSSTVESRLSSLY